LLCVLRLVARHFADIASRFAADIASSSTRTNSREPYHRMPLDPQRTLLIGMPVSAVLARTYKFFDTVDINEFRLIAWNAETFAADTQEKTGQSFESYHHPFTYRRFKELYDETIAKILS